MAGAYERFDEKVETEPLSGCWLWSGAQNKDGYGHFRLNGVDWRAHRLSYFWHKGDIPAGMIVRHKCDVPACVNPDHLELGSHADNAADKAIRHRSTATIPVHVVNEIRASSDKGCVLAERYGVSTAAVSLIRNRKSRKYV